MEQAFLPVAIAVTSLLLIVLFFLWSKRNQLPQSSTDSDLKSALVHVMRKEYDLALGSIKRIIEKREDNDFFYLISSELLYNLGHHERAIPILINLINASRNSRKIRSDAEHLLASIYFQKGMNEKALELYERFADTEKNPEMIDRLISLYQKNDETEKALHLLQKQNAPDLKRKKAELLTMLAIRSESREEYKLALKRYHEAVEQSPHALDALRRLALLLKKEGKYAKAIDTIKQLITVRPDYLPFLYTELEQCCFSIDDVYRVEKVLKDSMTDSENDKFIQLYLGHFSRKRKNTQDAIRYYRYALDLDSSFLEAKLALIETYLDEKSIDALIATTTDFIADRSFISRTYRCTKCASEYGDILPLCPECLSEYSIYHKSFVR